jgi:membrane protease YdiL (CAAX protease family)
MSMRRQCILAVTGIGGSGLLRLALAARPGSTRFFALTLATAGVWTAGAVASGYPIRAGARRPAAVGTGVVAFLAFLAAMPVAQRLPVLDRAIGNLLRHADAAPAALVLLTSCANAVGEELFFRGALYTALERHHPVAGSAAAYTLVTATTRNPALSLAGAAMGLLFAVQRRASRGVRAPVLTHLTWSILMARLLPTLFPRQMGQVPVTEATTQTARHSASDADRGAHAECWRHHHGCGTPSR